MLPIADRPKNDRIPMGSIRNKLRYLQQSENISPCCVIIY